MTITFRDKDHIHNIHLRMGEYIEVTASCINCDTEHLIFPDPDNEFYSSALQAYVECGVSSCITPEECHVCRQFVFDVDMDSDVLAPGDVIYNSITTEFLSHPMPNITGIGA